MKGRVNPTRPLTVGCTPRHQEFDCLCTRELPLLFPRRPIQVSRGELPHSQRFQHCCIRSHRTHAEWGDAVGWTQQDSSSALLTSSPCLAAVAIHQTGRRNAALGPFAPAAAATLAPLAGPVGCPFCSGTHRKARARWANSHPAHDQSMPSSQAIQCQSGVIQHGVEPDDETPPVTRLLGMMLPSYSGWARM